MSPPQSLELSLQTDDGHRFTLLARVPERPVCSLLWLPAMGVAARHYLPFAEALAQRGVAVFVHEWRGIGSSELRADRAHDWGYRELLMHDIHASEAAVAEQIAQIPRILGGHSLGGQLACCRRALAPDSAQALWLVASGAPCARAFPAPQRWWLPLAYRAAPWLAALCGYLPGRRIGFGGNEARGVIRDWARSALTGRYAASGIDTDLETAMTTMDVPVRAAVLRDDWFAPESSLRFLLSKMPRARTTTATLSTDTLHVKADHFTWMRAPDAVADALCAQPVFAAAAPAAGALLESEAESEPPP